MNLPPPGRPSHTPEDCNTPSRPHPPREGGDRSAPGGGGKQRAGGKLLRLCGDVGGTKTLLGVFDDERLVVDRRIANADFADFESLLAAFLADTRTDPAAIGGGCLALAGPIADDGRRARLTNLPWTIDSDALARRFGLPPPRLANDFVAAALGAMECADGHRHELRRGEPLAGAPRLVLGAGTGLGMAIVVPEAGRWRCLPGEGGHVAFAPADETQAALWSFLRARHGRVTWERVVSGPGLAAIGEFLGGGTARPEDIAARALTDPAGRDGRALDLFLAAYGAFAGDMALACLARGGVFLAGGIVAGILPRLGDGGFLAAFDAKAEHAALAARMPVAALTDPLLGLRGALRIAAG